MFLSTYVIRTDLSLHDWNKSNNTTLPCNEDMFGVKLVRMTQGDNPWRHSKPEKTTCGESFSLITKVCLNGKKIGDRFLALTKDEALAKFCKSSGLEKVYDNEESYAKAEPVENLRIKGIKMVNTFIISGCFRVTDEELFINAYNNGVGARKSYGCGLLVVI